MLLSNCLTGYRKFMQEIIERRRSRIFMAGNFRCHYRRFMQEIIEKNLLEYSWLVTIFFWSSPSLVFEVVAMASRHSLSSSRFFFSSFFAIFLLMYFED